MRERLKSISKTACAIWISVLVLLAGTPVQAQSLGGVDFQHFHADIVVHEDATISVTEIIGGSFSEPRHGIFRSIPVVYDAGTGLRQSIAIDVQDVRKDGEPTPYDAYREGDFLTVKIGDADVYVEGAFEYEISYVVDRAMLYHASADELYWNVTGNEWGDVFGTATASVLVDGVDQSSFDVSCYTGYAGSTEQNCDVAVSHGRVEVSATDFLTLSVSFPKGVVREPTDMERWMWWLTDNWGLGFLIIPVIAFFGLYAHWWKYGRDTKPDTIIPQYDPPDALRPVEVGALVDATVHNQDFSATIVDWAVRGHLTIEENEEKGLLFSSKKFVLHRKSAPNADLAAHERALYDALFSGSDQVTLDDTSVRTRLVKARKTFEKAVYADMGSRQFFVKDPVKVRTLYSGIGVVFFIVGWMLTTGAEVSVHFAFATAAMIATALLFIVFSHVMPKRTEQGDRAFAHALGFKMYLEKAEQYRIQWQEKEGIFERFLPYAMVYGVADKWAKAFADVAHESPSWYTGHAAFSAVNFSNSMTSFSSTMATASAPKSSGGSGGGGSSGGGFGGGGGGSW